MLSRNDNPYLMFNYNFSVDSVFNTPEQNFSTDSISSNFLLLGGGDFLLLGGGKFLLL